MLSGPQELRRSTITFMLAMTPVRDNRVNSLNAYGKLLLEVAMIDVAMVVVMMMSNNDS